MRKILYKSTVKSEVEGLEKLLNLKNSAHALVRDFEDENDIVGEFDWCVLMLDFENTKELERAEKFVQNNKHLKFCAYVSSGGKDAIINAHRIGCNKLVSKAEDLKAVLADCKGAPVPESLPKNAMYSEFRGLKVLVVDDVVVNVELLKDILAPFEFETVAVTDPHLAAEMIENTKFDLILADIVMPGLNGFELARRAKKSELNHMTPVAFVSGNFEAENKIEGFSIGTTVFLEKPLEREVVRAQLFGLLKIERLQTEMTRQKENFMAMLTHDLKTPIRAQIAALNLLLEDGFGPLKDGQREIVGEIMASNKYMQNMTDNVLLKYKSESGQFVIKKSLNDIKDTIENTVSKLKYIILQRNQSIKVHYDLNVGRAYYDEIEIERVLTNLIVNASEYSPENSEIGVYVKNEGERISVSVEDNGEGLETEEFEAFFDKYVSRAKDYKKIGTGLGLYICKKIISSHGGDIKAEKRENRGSRFTFTLSDKGSFSISL